MRALLILTVLGLAACGDDGTATNETAVENATAEEFRPANDTTAIDAASGEAANMAEDVNLLEDNLLEDSNASSPTDNSGS
jgi:hypothetical protein